MRANTLSTLVAMVISFFWGWLLGTFVLSDNRPNVWYDMDFGIWVVCVIYAFIHLFVGKILVLFISGMVSSVEKNTSISVQGLWTENMQMIYSSLWPVSIPFAVIAYPFVRVFYKRKRM